MPRNRYGERPGLAERVVAERKRRGLRQIDAAREIGIRRETLALIEVDHIPGRATRARIDRWMAAPPKPTVARPRDRAVAAGDTTGSASPGGPGGSKTAPPRGPGGRKTGRRLAVLASLAVRRKAERAYRRAAAAKAKRGRRRRVKKGKKVGKAKRGSGLG